ncbi:hypothetical protein RHMOL_Rhmol05G0006400 [Rhododendron molle]|uniref:Uncharacterized protein n=1 Tax=Rhododendron molle TaxID=49168 RepID=A0ACC0NKA5_RHOML|nr:hypothetical protein RHMOL_Rhmol05G0006400 [Rhododendron molle]
MLRCVRRQRRQRSSSPLRLRQIQILTRGDLVGDHGLTDLRRRGGGGGSGVVVATRHSRIRDDGDAVVGAAQSVEG